jgi:hypothetical protein
METQTGYGAGIAEDSERAGEAAPKWWAHAREFPHWYVWRGVTGLYYGRVPGTSPQRVLRGVTADILRDEIARTVALQRR